MNPKSISSRKKGKKPSKMLGVSSNLASASVKETARPTRQRRNLLSLPLSVDLKTSITHFLLHYPYTCPLFPKCLIRFV